jgi:hypothetical protein
MDDRSAILASEKAWVDFIRPVLRRLIDCGTPTTAKKYGETLRIQIFFGHLHLRIEGFCSGYIARKRMKIAPRTTNASEQAKSR